MNTTIIIHEEDPGTEDATVLMDELSDSLQRVTGRSGRASFDPDDVRAPRSLFVIARDGNGQALGCGAFRPMDEHTAEVKRMYARMSGKGTGGLILSHLEKRARDFGYASLKLETGLVNQQAVDFYEGRGYKRIPNYGKYVDYPDSVCFEKIL